MGRSTVSIAESWSVGQLMCGLGEHNVHRRITGGWQSIRQEDSKIFHPMKTEYVHVTFMSTYTSASTSTSVISVPDTASYIRGWIQMVLAPNDLFSWNNKYNKNTEYTPSTHSLVSSQQCTLLTLCMLASWSRGGVVFLDFLSSSHSILSFHFPYLGSTDAPCSRLGYPGPLFPRWRPHSLGPRTLPYRDPEQ